MIDSLKDLDDSMKSTRYLACPLVFSALILAGCAVAPVHDGTYSLKPEDSVDLSRDVTLTYDSFSDSRCPPGATCIWAGKLVFHFVLDGRDGKEEFMLGPDQPVATPAALRGARIALDVVKLPPARAGNAPRVGDVIPVTLTVTAPKNPLGAIPLLPTSRP